MSKRGNHEGSIYEQTRKRILKDGTVVESKRYAGAVSLDASKRKVFYGKTRADVAKKLSAALEQHDKGVPFTPDKLTVAKYLADWLEQSAKPKLKPSTYQTYKHYPEAHIIPALGNHPITKLGPAHVQAFLNAKSASGLAPRTVEQLHAILRSALNRAVKWQLVARNVATLVDVPRVPSTSVQPLTADGVIALLEAAREHPYEHLYAFLLATGMRLGEALALRWHDDDGHVLVDLDARRAAVRYTLERLRGGQGWRFTEPKSESGRRSVPLTAPAVATLHAQRARTAERRLQVQIYGVWEDHHLVFPNSTGAPLDGSSVYHTLKRLLAKAGLPTTHRVHDLRHSTATYLLAAHVDPRVVMAVMGWSQMSMLTRYQHILPAMLDDAAARLEIALPLAR